MAKQYISITDAAKQKLTSRQSIYHAMGFGKLDWEEIAGKKLIVLNEKFNNYQPQRREK